MAIENDLADRLAKASPNDSWRLRAELFSDDSSYLKSGLVNISAGWYPPGRSVRNRLFHELTATKFYILSINITLPNQRLC